MGVPLVLEVDAPPEVDYSDMPPLADWVEDEGNVLANDLHDLHDSEANDVAIINLEHEDEVEVEEEEEEEEEEDVLVVRAKWMLDGAKSIAEAIEKSKNFTAYLEELRLDGYEVDGEITDDYAHLKKA